MVPRPRLPRVGRSSLVLILTVAALAFPLGVLASHQFSDVPDSHDFHDDIAAIANAGVTTGCTATAYCPAHFVTRGQMAAFMNRLGSLDGSTPPSVNADETDDWDIGCPANTTWTNGLCLETSVRAAANLYDASEICGALGSLITGRGQQWQLPSSLVLRSAHNNADITLSAAGEWGDSLFVSDANGSQAMVAYPLGAESLFAPEGVLEDHPYRCGAVPLSFDPLMFGTSSGSPDSDIPAPATPEGLDLGPLNEDGSPAD